MWILNICVSASASESGAPILHFAKLILRIKKKTGKHCKYICLFYENFMSKQRIPPFLNNPPFSPTLPFLEKIFHLTLIAKLEEVNPPFV